MPLRNTCYTPSRLRLILLSLAVSLAATAAAGCHTYSVRRAAYVPRTTPVLRSGHPGSRAEVGIGSGSLISGRDPELTHDLAGIHLPRNQWSANPRVRFGSMVDVGLVFEHASADDAIAMAEDQPDMGDTDLRGFGGSVHVSVPTGNPEFRIGLGHQLINYTIPVVEYETCVDCEAEHSSRVEEKKGVVPVFVVSVSPSWRRDRLSVWGSFTIRNHPIARRSSIVSGGSSGSGVEAGRLNLVVAGGVEYELLHGVKLAALLYQEVMADPVQYGPTVAAALTVPLFRDELRAARPMPRDN